MLTDFADGRGAGRCWQTEWNEFLYTVYDQETASLKTLSELQSLRRQI